MALQNQTSKNQNEFFFATKSAGEQDLFTSTITAGVFSDFVVGIESGNAVQINQMPDVIGTVTTGGEQMLYAGTASTYKTLSSLSVTATGLSMSIDRSPASGIACIESYGTNGSFKGFEFLSRGVNSELVSTTSVGINNFMSSINRPGATAVIGATGQILTGNTLASFHTSLDVPSGGGGRGAFLINDLSGVQNLNRWALGTIGVPAGGNTGSDFIVFAYGDNGNFITSPMTIKRSDGAVAIQNISSIQVATSSNYGSFFPANFTNEEFGAEGKNEVIAGSVSNVALYGQSFAPLFSTSLTGLNPNGKTFVSINWENSLSSGSNHVNYKIGFSTSTAFTNTLTTSYVPGGLFTGSDLPSANTPRGYTLVTGCLDPDGVEADGTGVLFVQGQLSDPNAPADQLFIAKGEVTEATRNALTWHIM